MIEDRSIVRGAADGPLTPEGRRKAKELGDDFARKGGLTCVYLSTAKRARETVAAIVKSCPYTELEDPVDDILSWRLGEYEGEPRIEVWPKICNFVRFLPDVKLPGRSELTGKTGESFDDFRWRALPYIGKQLAEWHGNQKLKLGIVTHERVVRLLQAWIAGGMSPFFDVDMASMASQVEMGKPGSVWTMRPVSGSRLWTMEPYAMATKDPLEPCVYVVRHCQTALNADSTVASTSAMPGLRRNGTHGTS